MTLMVCETVLISILINIADLQKKNQHYDQEDKEDKRILQLSVSTNPMNYSLQNREEGHELVEQKVKGVEQTLATSLKDMMQSDDLNILYSFMNEKK